MDKDDPDKPDKPAPDAKLAQIFKTIQRMTAAYSPFRNASESDVDTVSGRSDFIVIDKDEQDQTLENLHFRNYSYHDDLSDSDDSLPDDDLDEDLYDQDVKAAVSVEDELRRLAEEKAREDSAGYGTLDGNGNSAKHDDDFDDFDSQDGEDDSANESPEESDGVGQEEEVEDELTDNVLMLAVKNDTPHTIDRLIDDSETHIIYGAMLYSITLGRDHITKMFIEHPKYETLKELTRMTRIGKSRAKSEEEGKDEDTTTSEFTPIMLASLRNQFDIVKLLLHKGERIDEPHNFGCKCDDCIEQTDELRVAKNRLNTYKALCSDAYIALSSVDPIHRAFELGQKLRTLAAEEKHFKAEYNDLDDQTSNLTPRILDKVRQGTELNILLNEKYGAGQSKADLTRLKLAVRFEEKRFVAHSACQKLLATLWIGDLNPAWVASPWRAVMFLILLAICYPFLSIIYWVNPKNKVSRFLRTPCVKFAAGTATYMVFIGILVSSSVTERGTSGQTLSEDPEIGPLYREYLTYTPYVYIEDVYMRFATLRPLTIVLCVWLLGMLWESMRKVIVEGGTFFTDNLFNLLNFIAMFMYVIAFCFRFYALNRVQSAISYFTHRGAWVALSQNNSYAMDKAYWLDADRRSWDPADFAMISEVFYALGSLLSIYKMTYVFTISERVGPLLLSLAKMFEDVLAFMLLFVFIIAAFVIGFHNLYWSTYSYVADNTTRQSQFSGIEKVVELFFWSIFGLVDMDESTFTTTNAGGVTSIAGQSFFAIYNWLMIIILINMLIAMMSRSYDIIADVEDTEWKFARTKLYLEYMREGGTLAAPFNLLPTWKGIAILHRKFADNWCYRMAGRVPPKFAIEKQKDNELQEIALRKERKKQEREDKERAKRERKENKEKLKKAKKRKKRMSISSLSDSALAERRQQRKEKKNAKMMVKLFKKKHDKPSDAYRKVMGEVIRRFTSKTNDDSAHDGIEQLQVDLSSLRQELMTNIFRQDRERAIMAANIIKTDKDVLAARRMCSRQHGNLRELNEMRVTEMKNNMNYLDKHMANVLEQMTRSIMAVQDTVTGEINDTKMKMRDHIEAVKSDMGVINEGLTRQNREVEMIQGTLNKQVSDVSRMHGTLSSLASDVTNVHGTLQHSVITRIGAEETSADPDTLVIPDSIIATETLRQDGDDTEDAQE